MNGQPSNNYNEKTEDQAPAPISVQKILPRRTALTSSMKESEIQESYARLSKLTPEQRAYLAGPTTIYKIATPLAPSDAATDFREARPQSEQSAPKVLSAIIPPNLEDIRQSSESPSAFLGLIQLWFEMCQYQWETTRSEGINLTEFLSAHREGRVRLTIIPRNEPVPIDPTAIPLTSGLGTSLSQVAQRFHSFDPIQDSPHFSKFKKNLREVIEEQNEIFVDNAKLEEENSGEDICEDKPTQQRYNSAQDDEEKSN